MVGGPTLQSVYAVFLILAVYIVHRYCCARVWLIPNYSLLWINRLATYCRCSCFEVFAQKTLQDGSPFDSFNKCRFNFVPLLSLKLRCPMLYHPSARWQVEWPQNDTSGVWEWLYLSVHNSLMGFFTSTFSLTHWLLFPRDLGTSWLMDWIFYCILDNISLYWASPLSLPLRISVSLC